jgi:hypothetical protein
MNKFALESLLVFNLNLLCNILQFNPSLAVMMEEFLTEGLDLFHITPIN